jgi:hypothetical protein
VVARHEVGVEAARRHKSDGGWGPRVLRAGQSESGEEGEVVALSEADGRVRHGAATVEQREEKGGAVVAYPF